MKRQIAAALVFMASAPGTLVADDSPARGGGTVYASIQELMYAIVDPSADVLWSAAGTVVDNEGVHDLSPKTPEEWRDVRSAALRIIEGGNLLMMEGREAAPPGTKSETPGVELEPVEIAALVNKNRKQFNAFANALQLVALEALQAIDAKNVDLLGEVGGRMDGVCESCHQTFWYPPPATK